MPVKHDGGKPFDWIMGAVGLDAWAWGATWDRGTLRVKPQMALLEDPNAPKEATVLTPAGLVRATSNHCAPAGELQRSVAEVGVTALLRLVGLETGTRTAVPVLSGLETVEVPSVAVAGAAGVKATGPAVPSVRRRPSAPRAIRRRG